MNESLSKLINAVQLVLPEAVLLATVCLIFLAAPFLVSERGEAPAGLRHRWGWLSLLALLAAGWVGWNASEIPHSTGPFVVDGLTLFIRALTLASGAILVLLQWNQADDSRSAESHACLLAILAGVNLVAAANDLVGLSKSFRRSRSAPSRRSASARAKPLRQPRAARYTAPDCGA